MTETVTGTVEAIVAAVRAKAEAMNRRECCGNGVVTDEGMACCCEPDLMLSLGEVEAALAPALEAHSQAFAQGAEAMRQRIVQRLTDPAAWMNPPDGGDPTLAEAQRNALIAVASLSAPPPSSPEPQKGAESG